MTGQPRPTYAHSRNDPIFDRPTESPTAERLIELGDAPYGHEPRSAESFTRDDYEQRWVDENGWDRHPPNGGAMPGTIVDYNSAEAFIRDYGDQVDRVGEPTGGYMAVKPDGVPATFDERALPISSLDKTYYSYQFTGHLPEGWHIRISETAPAFGRDGGSLQVQVLSENGEVQPIKVLMDPEVGVLI
jgi:hypothetical protein